MSQDALDIPPAEITTGSRLTVADAARLADLITEYGSAERKYAFAFSRPDEEWEATRDAHTTSLTAVLRFVWSLT